MSGRSFWSRSYKVIEKGANIFGFLSALVWIWALVFPGKAVSVLEGYEARFAGVEQSIAQVEDNTEALLEDTASIQDDTRALVAALPKGFVLDGPYHQQDCPQASGNPAEFTMWLYNQEQDPIQNATLTILDANGAILLQDRQMFINAQGEYPVKIPGINPPDRICVQSIAADGGRMASEYRVTNWRKTEDMCAESPNYGFIAHQGGVAPVSAADATQCQ